MKMLLHSMRTLCVTTLAGLLLSGPVSGSTWTTSGSGDYHTGSNWSGGVPNAAGAVADFSTLDFSGDLSVTANADITVGSLLFGDTNNAGSPTSWEFRSDNVTLPIITLDNGGSTPVITVNPLGPTGAGFDDAFIGVQVNGTTGFNKEGNGKLTLAAANNITGTIAINGGELNYTAAGQPNEGATNYTMANGTTLTTEFDIVDLAVASGAAVTVNQLAGGNQYMRGVHGQGTGESVVVNVAGGLQTVDGDWSGFDSVTYAGVDGTPTDIRARAQAGQFNVDSFANSHLTLNNTRFFTRTNSFGNNVTIGALSSDATGTLAGGNTGSAVRYIVGGLNTNTEFAGTIDGAGGLSLNKVGSGTLTLSGGVSGTTPVLAGNADPGRQGGVIRVSEGTLVTSGTFDHFDGGAGTVNSTIDVKPGAVLDVSGSTNTFHSVAQQQFIGAGTIRGAFDHQNGFINPGDVGVADNDSDLTNVLVPTVGTLTFDGSVSFNGGSIVFDMNETPGADDLVAVTGTTNLGSGGVIDPNFLGADPAVGQTYTVLNSTGGFSGSTAGWSVAWPGRGTKPSVFTNGNLLQFTTTAVGSVGDVVWSGATNGVWDIDTTQNWLLGGSPATYVEGDNVTFNDTGSNPTITIAATVAPSSMTVDSSTNNYSFSGSSILSTGSLVKRGSSTLTLGMTNEFNAGVTVEEGTIDATAAGALGTGPLELQANTTLTTSSGLNNSSINITGTGVTINNNVTSGVPNITGSGEVTFRSNVAGETRLSTGATETFSGTVNFTPDGGTFWVRAGGDTSDFPNAVVNMTSTTYSNRNGGTGQLVFSFGGLNGDANSFLSGFGGGSNPVPNAEFEIGGLNGDSTFAGVITDGGGGGGSVAVSSVRKIGTGTLTLSGANTYTGDTTVEAGTLSITQAFLADTANVRLTTGGILDLAFAGTDLIESLLFDGISQAIGTWGAPGSGAQHESAFFTGTGMLQVNSLFTQPGDFDNDGDVDGIDFLVWQRDPGVGNLADWQGNYGVGNAVAAASSSATAVPEPGTLVLCLMAGWVFSLPRRRQAA